MNKITKVLSAAFLCAAFTNVMEGQNDVAPTNYLNCGTSEAVNRSLAAHPELVTDFLKEQSRLEALDKEAAANGYKDNTDKSAMALPAIAIIPIVFHVLHVGGTENISDAQIIDEVRILNNDYNKLNADTSAVISTFKPVVANCGIQFRLAQKDPSGNCTNGIDRIYSTLTNSADDGSKLNDWPHNKYLNVWVVKTIGTAGVAGYAYLPGTTSSANDGVLILSTYIGSIGTGNPSTSRALTHEIGHFLNLNHTWGGTNNPGVACGDDAVTDTPITKGHTSCPLSDAVCTSGVIENVQNYMEYSYCSNMFTNGQKTRMRNALNSSIGSRSSLWATSNLTATGVSLPAVLCHADFESSKTTNAVCQGDSLTFTNLSWNGTPTSYSWTFAGGTPATSTDSMPTITYNTPGVYTVSMIVSNASGSVNATKTSYITVYPNTATYTASFYSEGFEGSAIPNTDWNVNNPDAGTNTWTQTNVAATTGTKSVRIVNASTSDGQIDELVSPPIDMSMITGTSPSLTFKVAYAQLTSTSSDKLQVYVSTNCTTNWVLRKSITGASLSTAGIVSSGSFVPTPSQWAMQTVNLSGYTSATSLFVMFRFTSNAGNNIYLDDINILGSLGIQDEIANNLNFNVYPNPADDNTTVAFNLTESQKTDISIYDVVGRSVATLYSGELGAGAHQYSVAENAKLSAGVYLVKLTVAGESFTKKLIVK
ncbi:MAG: M43 family zinc metalloprotease [Bacteroidia bacterium]